MGGLHAVDGNMMDGSGVNIDSCMGAGESGGLEGQQQPSSIQAQQHNVLSVFISAMHAAWTHMVARNASQQPPVRTVGDLAFRKDPSSLTGKAAAHRVYYENQHRNNHDEFVRRNVLKKERQASVRAEQRAKKSIAPSPSTLSSFLLPGSPERPASPAPESNGNQIAKALGSPNMLDISKSQSALAWDSLNGREGRLLRGGAGGGILGAAKDFVRRARHTLRDTKQVRRPGDPASNLSPSKIDQSVYAHGWIVKTGDRVWSGDYACVRDVVMHTVVRTNSSEKLVRQTCVMKTLLNEIRGKRAALLGISREGGMLAEIHDRLPQSALEKLGDAHVFISRIFPDPDGALIGKKTDQLLYLDIVEGTSHTPSIFSQNLSQVLRFARQSLTLLEQFRLISLVHADFCLDNIIFDLVSSSITIVDFHGAFFVQDTVTQPPASVRKVTKRILSFSEHGNGSHQVQNNVLLSRFGSGAQGTEGFRAPEQANETLREQSTNPFLWDLFSFGMCIVHLLNRRQAIFEETIEEKSTGRKVKRPPPPDQYHHQYIAEVTDTDSSWQEFSEALCVVFNGDIVSTTINDYLRPDSPLFLMLRAALSPGNAGGSTPEKCIQLMNGLGVSVTNPPVLHHPDIFVGARYTVGKVPKRVHQVKLSWKGKELGWSVIAMEKILKGGYAAEYAGEVSLPGPATLSVVPGIGVRAFEF